MGKIVCLGEVLLRLSPPQNLRFGQSQQLDVNFGGAELNSASSIAELGLPVEFLTRLPLNDIGKRALSEIRKNNIGTSHIVFGPERMGIYFLENGAMQRPSKVIYDRAGSSMCAAKPSEFDWDLIFKDAEWFHFSGITPAISQQAADLCLVALVEANKRNITCSCDVNYRKNLWQYGRSSKEVMPDLLDHVHVLFGNEKDAELLYDIPLSSALGKQPENLKSIYAQMMGKMAQCKLIVSTKRTVYSASHNKLQGMVYDENLLKFSKEYEMTHIVDRVGGGDAFVAGFIYGYLQGMELLKNLEFATAASVLKHSVFGDANYTSVEEVQQLANGVGNSEVNR